MSRVCKKKKKKKKKKIKIRQKRKERMFGGWGSPYRNKLAKKNNGYKIMMTLINIPRSFIFYLLFKKKKKKIIHNFFLETAKYSKKKKQVCILFS